MWVIVRSVGTAQEDPFQTYEVYQCTPKETAQWTYEESPCISRESTTKLQMTAAARQGEHFNTRIWIVEVRSAEVPRYSDWQLDQMKWEAERQQTRFMQWDRDATFRAVMQRQGRQQ
jgi:hypothetical protein